MGAVVELREVVEADLPVFFEHQRDPEAVRMVPYNSRELEPFMAHWARIMAQPTGLVRAITVDGQVAGNVVTFESQGQRLVGYWIGREYWGKGIATKALAEFLKIETKRPLHAHVAKTNTGSVRVLQKCGFQIIGEEKAPDGVEEFLTVLR